MNSDQERIVVLQRNLVAAATIVGHERTPVGYTSTSLVSGHDALVFIAEGEGLYRTGHHVGVQGPNTLIAAPAGAFTCVLSDRREAYVLTFADTAASPDDRAALMPFVERKLSGTDARFWHEAMIEFADHAAGGRLETADVARLKTAAARLVWRRESQRETVNALLESLWPKVGEQLTLERIARDVGYTTNYLNDLMRAHTGRSVGRWITDMRMARARKFLEAANVPISDVATACGYEDPAYFSRAFRREHGASPLTWRIAARPVDQRWADVTLPVEALHALGASSPRSYSFAC
jgi:AraC-like DNA-binding protein